MGQGPHGFLNNIYDVIVGVLLVSMRVKGNQKGMSLCWLLMMTALIVVYAYYYQPPVMQKSTAETTFGIVLRDAPEKHCYPLLFVNFKPI